VLSAEPFVVAPRMWGVCGVISVLATAVAAATPAAQPTSVAGGRYLISQVGNFSVPVRPGYAELLPEVPGQLVLTSFGAAPFVGKNAVYLYGLDKGCGDACLQQLPGSEGINWPNAVAGLNSTAFGFPAVVVGNGFLVPSHTTGGVWIMEASAHPEHLPRPVKITKDKAEKLPDSGWFYHLAAPFDMNGDGRLDFVTARCQFGVWPWSKKRGELLWLQQPEQEPLSGAPWEEHHLAEGPDFLFCLQPGLPTLALAATEFIGERTVYYYMSNGTLQSRVLDEQSGPGFSCSWTDLNGDGRLELLATNHLNQNGSVFAYTFDGDDFSTAGVSRHVLASGFSAITTQTGTAGPGDAAAFQPSTGHRGKPYIFVSGDNGNDIFVLVPRSEDPGDWSYTRQKIADVKADVGRPAIGDTDGDGFADVFVPAYDLNKVLHYTFSAAPDAAMDALPIVV